MGKNFKNICDNMTLYFKTKDGGSVATAMPIVEGQSYTKTWEEYDNDEFYCTFNIT